MNLFQRGSGFAVDFADGGGWGADFFNLASVVLWFALAGVWDSGVRSRRGLSLASPAGTDCLTRGDAHGVRLLLRWTLGSG